MEKPFKIGVWIGEDDLPEAGGGFSYTQRLISAINEKKFSDKLEVIFVGHNLKKHYKKNVVSLSNKEVYFKRKIINFFHKIFSIKLEDNSGEKIKQHNIKQLNKEGIELIFYPNPFVRLLDFPYICTLWDLGHKSTYSFPELSANNEYEHRDFQSNKLLNKALFICCESASGKNELIKYYNINQNKIGILPIFPGKIVDDDMKEEKPDWIKEDETFLLYPAQFWPHKNHYNLLIAFKQLIVNNHKAKLILTGSNKGNLNYIMSVVTDLELNDMVILSGFIKNETLKWLYLNTIGLVFPSFLGPTNMPLLEAYYLGCNIACSNIEGHVELLKDEAIYFEPHSSDSICKAMTALMTTDKKLGKVPFNIDPTINKLQEIFEQIIPIRRTWGRNYPQ